MNRNSFDINVLNLYIHVLYVYTRHIILYIMYYIIFHIYNIIQKLTFRMLRFIIIIKNIKMFNISFILENKE